ncbi:hypothetical protein A5798_000293 [Enterococcus sp. 6C8_DIV0013]|nr:hypothetical protein A5798_000293 [Enterococcus sp. 6C8_DIV0013]
MMERYKTALRMFLIGLVLFLVMLKPVSQVEKLNFLINPYFLLFVLSLLLLFISTVSILLRLLIDLVKIIIKKLKKEV